MPEAPVRVAVPWSLSRYMALNSFHPLAQSWFVDNRLVDFRTVDIPALARALEHSGWFAAESGRRSRNLARAWIDAAPDLELLPAFIAHATGEELWAASDLPADMEFHHTCPMTAGTRPFVFYCEAFLPIFFPYFQHGGGEPRDHEEVRALFGSILGAPACLGILSHIPEALAEISGFFRNPAIDAKLAQVRVGMLDTNLQRLLEAPRGARGDGPVFLFTNSAHQNPNSIPLRGGRAVLLFAERYLRAGHPGRFVLRAARPTDEMLKSWGVDAAYLRSMEPARIEWIEQFLDMDEQMALFVAADVMLLPSAGLHSLTLMQALAAGAIPVVTDTWGTEHYVEDGRTGVVLRGVRSGIWQVHEPSGVRYDRYDVFPSLTESLVSQMFEKLVPLLSSAEAVLTMRERMRAEARERFSGAAYRDSVCGELVQRWRAYRGRRDQAAPPSLLERFGAVRAGDWDRIFAVPPMPRQRGASADELVFAGGSAYFRVRGARLPNPDQWSPFALRRHGLLGVRATRVFASLRDMEEDASLSAAGQVARSLGAKLDFARRRWAK